MIAAAGERWPVGYASACCLHGNITLLIHCSPHATTQCTQRPLAIKTKQKPRRSSSKVTLAYYQETNTLSHHVCTYVFTTP